MVRNIDQLKSFCLTAAPAVALCVAPHGSGGTNLDFIGNTAEVCAAAAATDLESIRLRRIRKICDKIRFAIVHENFSNISGEKVVSLINCIDDEIKFLERDCPELRLSPQVDPCELSKRLRYVQEQLARLTPSRPSIVSTVTPIRKKFH